MITFVESNNSNNNSVLNNFDGPSGDSNSFKNLSILQIEDNPGDLILVFEMLCGHSNYNFNIEEATTLRSAIRQLRTADYDAILLDLSLPDSEGLETLEAIRSLVFDTPIIVLTGRNHEETAIKAIQKGAQDYLIKNEIEPQSLFRSIRYSIDRKQTELQLTYQAKYDDLTDLANRSLFYDRLEQALVRSKRHKQITALLFMDLDRFKLVNDTYGHNAGDVLLKKVATRIKQSVREGDTVARMGGDEFTITLENVDKKASVSAIAKKVIESLSQSFDIEGIKIQTSISIGIVLNDNDDITPAKEMVRYADIAMYHAKKYGRNNFKYFNAQMERLINQQDYLEKSLSQALKKGEFYLKYQPQIDIRTNALVGAEALMRWRNIKSSLINAEEFMPIIEKIGLVVELGRWAMEKACIQWFEWQQAGEVGLHDVVSIDVPVRLLKSQNFEATVSNILNSSGLSPSCLNLSFPESWLIEEKGSGLQKLNKLKKLGVKISMNGTDFYSLTDFKHMPIDCIKIDPAHVKRIIKNKKDAASLASIMNIANDLGLEVIAEGIDELGKVGFLQEQGCHTFQGDFFGRPLSSQTFPNFTIENQYSRATGINI